MSAPYSGWLLKTWIRPEVSGHTTLFDLKYWQNHSGESTDKLNVIIGGDTNYKTADGNYFSWKYLFF